MFCHYRDETHRSPHSFPTRRSSDLYLKTQMMTKTLLWKFGLLLVAMKQLCLLVTYIVCIPVMQKQIVGKQKLLKRSEEHTSELQSRGHLVCRLLLENKKYTK